MTGVRVVAQPNRRWEFVECVRLKEQKKSVDVCVRLAWKLKLCSLNLALELQTGALL